MNRWPVPQAVGHIFGDGQWIEGLVLTNPTDTTVLVDTGALLKGVYLVAVTGSGSADWVYDLQHRNASTDAKAKGEKLIVVSHSWGTFLTYAALYDEPEITVDLYITLASPLGTRLHPRGADTMEGNLITGYVQYWLFRLGLPSENHHLSNVKTAVNYWAYGDLISGPLSLSSASSNIMVDSGEENNYTPDLQSTEKWHKYDSLQPGSVPDNQPLRDMVAGNIFALLGGPAVGFTLGNAGIPVDLTLPDTFKECSEYSAVENKIHVPCLSLGSSTFWIDLLPHTTATPLLLKVGGFGENVPSAP